MNKKWYRANPVVSCREEEDGAVLFNPDTDDMVIINPSGLVIWEFLAGPRTIAQISTLLVEQFQCVSRAQVTVDAESFLAVLRPDFVDELGESDAG